MSNNGCKFGFGMNTTVFLEECYLRFIELANTSLPHNALLYNFPICVFLQPPPMRVILNNSGCSAALSSSPVLQRRVNISAWLGDTTPGCLRSAAAPS